MKNRQVIAYTVFAIIALIAIYGVAIVRHGFSAKDQPSALEVVVARSVRNLSFAVNASHQQNPLPASAGNLHEGMEHFADHCAFCHANDGSGNSETGRNLYPKPPDLRQAQTQRLTDGEIYTIIANGVRFTGMPASDHEPDDNWRLVLFIRHLPQLSANEQREMERINPNSGEDHHHHPGEHTH